MTSKTRKDLIFAVLAFGCLGESAKISFKSIDSLNPRRIYVMADKSGRSWMEKEVMPYIRSNITLFEPREVDLKELSLIQDEHLIDYSEFGKQRFIRLTAFKWDLIRRSLLDSDSDIFFSDLDVIWLASPEKELAVEDDAIVWAQDDTPSRLKRKYFCTGIMLWKNSYDSINVLDELFENQCENILLGRDIPDEPTFNLLVRASQEMSKKTRALSAKTFVVGHRFFFSFFNFRINHIIAFHANYVKGEQEKYRRLEAVRRRNVNDYSWIFLFFRCLLKEVRTRINTLDKKIQANAKNL